jgi:SAM-dependent methyltransferase
VPRVFDARLQALRRARAAAGFAEADFLKRRAVEDLCERLELVTRDFPLALDLGAHTGQFAAEARARGLLGGRIGWLMESETAPAMLAGRAGPAFVAGGGTLAVAGESLDLIVSALSLHWVDDLPGLFAQARRALKPDGLFLAAFFGGRTLWEVRACLVDAELEVRGGAGARVSPFADAQDGARLLQRAGFALPVADTDVAIVRYANVFALFRDLKAMGETAAFADRAGKPLTRSIVARASELYHERHADPDGRVRATFEIVTATGWAPHESQQKPLRPGTARTRLAEALGTVERPAGEKAGGG